MHVAKQRQVDHHAAVVGTESGRAVPASLDGQVQSGVPGEVHRSDDIGNLLGLDDHLRMLVEHAVVNGSGLVVTGIALGQHGRPDVLPQLLDGRCPHRIAPFCQGLPLGAT